MKCPHCGREVAIELRLSLLSDGKELGVFKSEALKKVPKSGAQRTREFRARKKSGIL